MTETAQAICRVATRRRFLLAAAGFTPALALAELDENLIDDVLREGARWVEQNIDPEFLRSLQDVDQEKALQFFQQLQRQFQSEQLLDVVQLKAAAQAVLPLLEQDEDTRPYASWLKARMDYFSAAEELKREIPPPKIEPGVPIKPVPNPTAEQQRKTWAKQLDRRPLPKEAALLVPKLKPIFLAQKVPDQLVWVAEVESGFNPKARSPAGAVGLFQLMPRTAQSLGLSLWPRDERLQPEKCAGAAAKYLGNLHGQFKNWHLTLAAYNAGEGTIRKALTRYKATSFDKIAPHLPSETQMYVPKVEATIRLREGVELTRLPAAKR